MNGFFSRTAKYSFFAGVFGAAIGFGVFLVFVYQVFFGDDSNLKRTAILAKINEETTVYYRDGESPIGSFFDSTHRRYVHINEVPADLINALVAAEDKNYFEHSGVDPVAIVQVVIECIQNNFRCKRGGSTLTQQTIKNLIKRSEKTIQRKFREWIAALQLERIYTKREILEFYLNQFHVANNGNGIGIAAKYFFNKDPADLSLVECAFIAGSVKGPSKYNPFIKFTVAAKQKAIEYGFIRKNYVLERMYSNKMISKEQYEAAKEAKVNFNKGSFGSRQVSLVNLVKRQLDRKEILDPIGVGSVDELSHAGLKIITTLDQKLQSEGHLGLQRSLSGIETSLSGFTKYSEEEFKSLRRIEPGHFYFGKVSEIKKDKDKHAIHIDFGIPKGIISHEALLRYASLIDQSTARGQETEYDMLISKINVGDILFVEVTDFQDEDQGAQKKQAAMDKASGNLTAALESDIDRDSGEESGAKSESMSTDNQLENMLNPVTTATANLELHRRPDVNGGLFALDKGNVRSVLPGFETMGFNRAWDAKRQPGSVFKMVVFFASCQLGWSVLDNIDNQRQVFPYQSQLYFPKPDHASPYRKTSIIWSGVMSENLATVNLAYRLTEKLNFSQFKQLMGFLDLLPEDGESNAEYHYRVARKIGVTVDDDGIGEYQLQRVIAEEIVPELTFSNYSHLIDVVSKMWWGRAYKSHLEYLTESYSGQRRWQKELPIRIKLTKNNFLRFKNLSLAAKRDWKIISDLVQSDGVSNAMQNPQTAKIIRRFRKLGSLGSAPHLGYYQAFEDEVVTLDSAAGKGAMFNPMAGLALNSFDVQAIWGGGSEYNAYESQAINLEDVRLGGYLPLQLFEQIEQAHQQRLQKILAQEQPYQLHRYFNHHDFRVAMGLNYLVHLVQAMGVRSPIKPVLSFPLGTNDVSLAEVAKVYQTMISGKIYRFYEDGPPNQVNLIEKILDRDGEVLFEPKPVELQLVGKECAYQTREILKNIVNYGTGRRAKGELYIPQELWEQKGLSPELSDLEKSANQANDNPEAKLPAKVPPIRIPVYGKTGTTNDFNTSSFAGFIPYPIKEGEPLDPYHSLVLSSYVGYDIPKPMVKGRFKVSGAKGALKVWIEYGKSMIHNLPYIEYFDRYDIVSLQQKTWPLAKNSSLRTLQIDLPRGLILRTAPADAGENFRFTDFSRTGEVFESEFAHGIGRNVYAKVAIPGDKESNSWQPLKQFNPFAQIREDEVIKVSPSRVVQTQEKKYIGSLEESGDGAAGNAGSQAGSNQVGSEDRLSAESFEDETENDRGFRERDAPTIEEFDIDSDTVNESPEAIDGNSMEMYSSDDEFSKPSVTEEDLDSGNSKPKKKTVLERLNEIRERKLEKNKKSARDIFGNTSSGSDEANDQPVRGSEDPGRNADSDDQQDDIWQ